MDQEVQKLCERVAALWERGDEGGYLDEEDIEYETFLGAQYAIGALRNLWTLEPEGLSRVVNSLKPLEILLQENDIDLESITYKPFKQMDEPVDENGNRYFQLGMDLNLYSFTFVEDIVNPETELADSISDYQSNFALIVENLWQEYAILKFDNFYCNYPNDRDYHEFGLESLSFQSVFPIETYREISKDIYIPHWARIYVRSVQTEDIPYEDSWGEGNFLSHYIQSESTLLLHALYAREDELSLRSERFRVAADIEIVQSDSGWSIDEGYFNWFDYGVNPNLDEIRRLQEEDGLSYSKLTDDQKSKLVSVGIEAMNDSAFSENKVAQYLLTLFLNHPATPVEAKAQIALLSDEHIIKLED